MTLLLFRHAAAAPIDPDVVAAMGADAADEARTPRGRRRFKRMARAVGRQGFRVERLLHSPLRRAVETAELLVPVLHGTTAVCPELIAPPNDALLAQLHGDCVAVVGHEPWLSETVRLLTGAALLGLRWRKGGLVVLEGQPVAGGMRIAAVVSPRWFR
jgi:phosphohistidine phosphatase